MKKTENIEKSKNVFLGNEGNGVDVGSFIEREVKEGGEEERKPCGLCASCRGVVCGAHTALSVLDAAHPTCSAQGAGRLTASMVVELGWGWGSSHSDSGLERAAPGSEDEEAVQRSPDLMQRR